MTDSAGVVRWSADYKPFGEAAIDTQVTTITNNLRFPGQYFDQETGLHYNYYRDYNPAIGRYPEADPIGLRAGLNLYAYVVNNPAKFVDMLGLDYSLSEYHVLVPGSEDWNNKNQNYNCMAWGVGSDVWQQDEDPQKVPPKFGCNQVDCNSECKQCQNKIKIYEDKSDYTKWHVYKQVDGQWSCKYGHEALAAVLDPGKDYVDVYNPKGKITETCWCCPK